MGSHYQAKGHLVLCSVLHILYILSFQMQSIDFQFIFVTEGEAVCECPRVQAPFVAKANILHLIAFVLYERLTDCVCVDL